MRHLFFQKAIRVVLPLIFAISFVTTGLSAELIITNPKKSNIDVRFDYPLLLLEEAMERTVDRYGSYRIERYPESLTRKRVLALLVRDEITVFEAATRREWEASAIPVRIPLRKGVIGYRVFFIREEDQKQFSMINSLEELLNNHRMGQGAQWSITQVFKRLDIDVVGSAEYEPLFKMLMAGRFDYFPRGINEVNREFSSRKEKYPTLKIEETLSLYLPLPTYFFVSPNRPELAKRIEIGLLSMLDDGTFDKIFMDYHGADIEEANLNSRKIFSLNNPNLSDETPFHRTELWYKP